MLDSARRYPAVRTGPSPTWSRTWARCSCSGLPRLRPVPAEGPPAEDVIGDREPHGDCSRGPPTPRPGSWPRSRRPVRTGSAGPGGKKSAARPIRRRPSPGTRYRKRACTRSMPSRPRATASRCRPRWRPTASTSTSPSSCRPTARGRTSRRPIILETGPGGSWLLDLGPQGLHVLAGDEHGGVKPTATVTADPSDMVLAFYRRDTAHDLQIDGDAELVPQLINWPNLD